MEDTNLKMTMEMLNDHDLTTIERIILASTDTVQSLMSVIFGTPVRVEVIAQLKYDAVMVRWAKLISDDPDPVTVALAESVIPLEINHASFIHAMDERDIGIGQAITKRGTFTQRKLLGIHVDEHTFSRTYQIKGFTLDILITEIFNRELFNVS